jgi:hypothetical protein
MTDDPGGSAGTGPDLHKNDAQTGDGHQPTPAFSAPANPYPAADLGNDQYTPGSYAPSRYPDQFVPYPPPYQPDPEQYPAPQYPAAPQFGGAPQFGRPPQFPGAQLSWEPKQASVGITRILGAVALVGALIMVAYGWLTWASFEAKGGGPEQSVTGWGDVVTGGESVELPAGASGAPYAAVFIPLFVIPVIVLGLLVVCNIGRFGNSIAILVLSALHLLLAIIFLAAPSICILFDSDLDSELFEATNNFSTGPGAVMATLTLAVITGTSIAGIVLGRKTTFTQTQQPNHGQFATY